MPECSASARVGQRAPVAMAAAVISAATQTKRTSRNENGGASGSPSFAATNPVLQSRTNSAG